LIDVLVGLSEADRNVLQAVYDQTEADINTDSGVLALIQEELSKRGTEDQALDLLDKLRDGYVLEDLKLYVDNILAIQNPNLLTGITSRLIYDNLLHKPQEEINQDFYNKFDSSGNLLTTKVISPEGITQNLINDKTLKWKQLEPNSIERDLTTRSRASQYVGDYASIQNAADAKRSNTVNLEIEPNTLYTLTSNLSLSGYTFLKGSGFYSRIKCNPGTGVVYSPTGIADDHAQQRISDLQIVGDGTLGDYLSTKNGTTTGLSWSGGAYHETHGVLFNAHNIGLSIVGSYTNLNRYNYYRACKTGLYLKNITSHREEMPYMRYNSTAGLEIDGAFQNITIDGGAIEGNIGRGIWIHDTPSTAYPKLILNDIYLESNGNLATGIPAVDINEHDRLHVSVIGGSYWNNALSGVTTGPYRWGTSVSFENTTMNGFHFAKTMSVVNGIDAAAYNTGISTTNMAQLGYSEPTMMTRYLPSNRVDGYGPVFQVPFSGRTTRKFLQANEITMNYPHVLNKSTSTTLSENTALDYGDGSWTDITLSASRRF